MGCQVGAWDTRPAERGRSTEGQGERPEGRQSYPERSVARKKGTVEMEEGPRSGGVSTGDQGSGGWPELPLGLVVGGVDDGEKSVTGGEW